MLRRSLPSQARSRGVTAVLGPTNTGKTHLAIERMLGHASGMIGLPLRLLAREVYQQRRRQGRRGQRRPRHRRGEDQAGQAALLGLDRRGDAARPRRRLRRDRRDPARRRPRPRPRLHRPAAEPARPRGDAAHRLRDHAPAGRGADPGRARRSRRPRLSKLTFAGEKKISRLPQPLRHRRLLGRGGLRHRRADPAPARRRGGGARRALAAHPQRPGRAVPDRRRRLPRRHRRDRHGPQPRRRPRRLRLRQEIRRLPLPQAPSGRARPDRRPRRPPHARRHLRHHGALPALRSR